MSKSVSLPKSLKQNNYLLFIDEIENLNIQKDDERYNHLIIQIGSYMKEDFPKSYLSTLELSFPKIYDKYKKLKNISK